MILHLFHHMYRGQRGWLWMFWLLSAVQAVAGSIGVASEGVQVARTIIFLGQCFAGAIAVIMGIQAHPVASSNAMWLTRPIARQQVIRAELLYVFGMVVLPLLTSLLIGWVQAGFTGTQLVATLLEWLIIVSAFVVVGAAAAAHTRNIAQFFAVMGGSIGFMFIAAMTVAYIVDLEQLGALRRMRGSWTPGSEASSLLVGLLLISVGTLVSWIVRTLSSRFIISLPTAAIPLLLLLPITILRPFNFLKQADNQVEGTTIELVTESRVARVTAPDEQLLWSHFRVLGLPENSLVVPTTLNAWFRATNGFKLNSRYSRNPHDTFGIDQIKSSPVRGVVMEIMRRLYPEDTAWSGNWSGRNQDGLPVSSEGRVRWPKDPVGTFDGTLRAGILQLLRIADVPLKPAFVGAGEGFGVAIVSVRDESDGLKLQVVETGPNLKFTGQEEYRATRYWKANYLYVLHHPDSGEAYIVDNTSGRWGAPTFLNNQSMLTLRMTVPRSALRERLTGYVAEDWFSGLRLHVYRPRLVGTLDHGFSDQNYHFVQNRLSSDRGEASTQSGVEMLKQMKWPGPGEPAVAQKFAHDFLFHASDRYTGNQGREVTKLLTDIGPDIVPFLLREAPFSEATKYMVLRGFLSRTIRREHLAELQSALERDPSLAWLLRSKRWEKDGVDALAKSLPNRNSPLPADALLVIAKHSQPAQFADLSWHAARCKTGQEFLYRELRELKDFPYAETVRESWKRARLGIVADYSLAVFAAEIGELDALHVVIRQLDSGQDEARNGRSLEILSGKLDFKGDESAKKDWLLKNADRIRFEAEQSRYVVSG